MRFRFSGLPVRAALLFSFLLTPTGAQTPPSVSPPPAAAAIHVAELRQPIYGFGGSITYNGDQLADFPGREAMYRLLFGDLKLDILRLRNYFDYPGQEKAFDARTRELGRAARRWSGKKTRGDKGPVRLMLTSWSPPPRLKSNRLVSGRVGGTDAGAGNATLARGTDGKYAYDAFAEWWLDSVRKFKSLCGAFPDYIALQNEADIAVTYEGCQFLPTEGADADGNAFAGYDKALNAVAGRLGTLGKETPKILGPETFTIQTSLRDKNHVQFFVDPSTASGRATLDKLFGVSFHIYGIGAEAANPPAGVTPNDALSLTALSSLPKLYRTDTVSKPLFQNEFLEGETMISLAGMIHDTLTVGEASAYLTWIIARSTQKPGLAMVYFDPDTGIVQPRERYYAVKAFSAFVGEGWRRVAADCTEPSIKLSAYLGPDSRELVVVVINPTLQERHVTLAPDGTRFSAAVTGAFRSSEGEGGERWRALAPLPASNLVTLLPRSVATVRFRLTP